MVYISGWLIGFVVLTILLIVNLIFNPSTNFKDNAQRIILILIFIGIDIALYFKYKDVKPTQTVNLL
jgi:hypothetical protein